MNISIIVPNYNGENILAKNLPKIFDSVKEYKKGKIEIIIPDDPSTDNSKEVINNFIANNTEKNIIVKTIENRNSSLSGFSKNVNRGVGIATGDILILLNSDVAPHKDFLEPLLRHFSAPDVFAVGCMDESIENGKTLHRGRGLGRFRRGFLVHRAGEANKSSTLWVSGGSGAFRRSIWDKLGGLDALYDPFYWEDIDLSYRALKAGYRIVFEPESVVVHEHEAGVVKKLFSEKHVRKVAYRNQIIFVWKNITDSSLLANHLFWLPYHIAKTLFNHDLAFVLGLWMACGKLPAILKNRAKLRKYSKLKDKDIMKLFIS